jgi:hypothetical protein
MTRAVSAVKLFGSEPRRYRNEANTTLDAVGKETNYTGALIGPAEQGKRTPPA